MKNIKFIGFPKPLNKEFSYDSPAPLFRRHFEVKETFISANLKICVLGLGEIYFNGEKISDELFISPFSDYKKTLWFNEYDITDKILQGQNLVAIALGNGFYNESLATGWDFDKAPWRDNPKFYFDLEIKYSNGIEHILSDENWLCELQSSPYRFNEFRMGEIYDFNYSAEWMNAAFDDSKWVNASIAENPGGIMRKSPAPPIKEQKVYPCQELFKNQYGEWVFDFGQNMSGYVKLNTKQPKGTRLHIVYAEQLSDDFRRKDNYLAQYFYDGETQFSTVITGEKEIDWKPVFTYYGFRYVIISGFENEPNQDTVNAVFVHQDVKSMGSFNCSNDFLNKLYNMSRMSTLSNLFNMPTDCPTREKLGWCNDAQASCEQMIQNFDMTDLYKKWLQDIMDAQKTDGDLPGIVPTNGWGYEWGSGPVSNGVLFEIPYRLYQYNGDKDTICDLYPTMCKYLEFLENQKYDTETGLFAYGLPDWAGPWPENECPTPLEFICTVLYIRFCDIALIAARLLKKKEDEIALVDKRDKAFNSFNQSYMLSDGRCRIEEQTAISLIIANGFYTELEPLKQQLINAIQKYDFHFHVGMLGIQYILPALDICNLNEAGYKLLTASGYPSYRIWVDDGATTLHEMFGNTMSCNHHMYSCVVAWFHNCILGIRFQSGSNELVIKPAFLKELTFASGNYTTNYGTVSVSWKKISATEIELYAEIPETLDAKLVLDECYECIDKNIISLTAKKNKFLIISR